jgi:YVTN family beta-propeller protein
VETFGFGASAFTGSNGRYDVTNARLNATWIFQVQFNPTCNQTYPVPAAVGLFAAPEVEVTTSAHDFAFECATEVDGTTYVTPGFLLSSAMPSSITVSANEQQLSSGSGTPTLYVNDRNGNTDATLDATSFTTTSATFPTSSLTALSPDMYAVAITTSSGAESGNYYGSGWFALGQDSQTFPAAFGVDAIHYSAIGTECSPNLPPLRGVRCTSVNNVQNYPVVTLLQSSEVSFDGRTVTVGTTPTVVHAYGITTTTHSDGYGGMMTYTQPQYALVVNTGSNSVTIVNLQFGSVVATIPVGSHPVDAKITSDNSTAYVVNYGSGTVSKISLSSYAVVATGSVDANPTAVDLNASGDPVVGGANYIATLDPNSLAVTANNPTSAPVIAIGVSQGKNQVVSATANGSGNSQTASINSMSLPSYSQAYTSQAVSTAPFIQSSISGQLAFPSQTATGVLISPILNNSFAAEATPSGFMITDLETNQVLLAGNTPHPVRGLAVDATNGYFYFTMPDSNSVVKVAIPTAPLSPNVLYGN